MTPCEHPGVNCSAFRSFGSPDITAISYIYESLFALTVQQWIQCNTIQYVKGKYRHSMIKVKK